MPPLDEEARTKSHAPRATTPEGLTEIDISSEAWRRYHFASGHTYQIDVPHKLVIRKGGTTHRIIDEGGLVHCVAFPGPNGDTTLTWMNREGYPKVVA